MNTRYKQISLVFLSLLVYSCISIAFFGIGIINHLNKNTFITGGGDTAAYIWSLKWTFYAVQHFINPFITNLVWFPYGFNITQGADVFGEGIISLPITALFGPLVAFNLMMIFASALSALAAYILCKYITKKFWPSFFGGYLYGFSSYEIAHLLGHLSLVTIYFIPLMIYLFLLRLDENISRKYFILFGSVCMIMQYYFSKELYAIFAFFSSVTFVFAYYYFEEKRNDLNKILLDLIGIILISTLFILPSLYYFLSTPLSTDIPSAQVYSNDFLSFIIPTQLQLISSHGANQLSIMFSGGLAENTGYLGLPLILIFILFCVEFWQKKIAKFLIFLLAFIMLASLGPILHIAGIKITKFPGFLITHMPLIKHALPNRFMPFAFLLFSVLISLWLLNSKYSNWMKYSLAILSILFLMPKHNGYGELTIPDFFTSKIYKKYITAKDNIQPIPTYAAGKSTLWQEKTNFSFHMTDGYLGGIQLPFLKMQIVYSLYNKSIHPDEQFNDFLKKLLIAYLKNNKVTKIIVANNFTQWRSLFTSIGLTSQHIDDIDLYIVPSNMTLKSIHEQTNT